jgi:hypothetical protein
MRLGEILVSRNVITEEQLAQALNAQLIYGGHIGTCMIELGFLDEDTLGNVLAVAHKIRYAGRDRLENIQPAVIATLSAAVAEKHRAIPFERSGRTLRVAMVDPRNLQCHDELSFVSGCRIEAWVSPEVRIFQALERYYEVARRLRYISIARRLDEKKPVKKAVPMVAVAAQGATAGFLPPSPALVPIEKPAAVVEPPPATEGGRAAGVSTRAKTSTDPLAEISDQMCRADDLARLAGIVLGHVTDRARRCALFSVRGVEAAFWDAIGFGRGAETFRGIRFEITTEPLLELIAGEPYYRGPVPAASRYRDFFARLRTEAPAECLIVPIHRQDRIAVILYLDGGAGGGADGDEGGRLQAETVEFLALAHKLALALDLIAIKRRIRST